MFVFTGYEKIVNTLILNNASINAVDHLGHTALDAAADATQGKFKKKKTN